MSTATNKKQEDAKKYNILLVGVRLSFANVFKPRKPKPGDEKKGEGKYGCCLILDKVKDAKQIETFQAKIAELLKEFNKGAAVGPHLVCLKDGVFKPNVDGYSDKIMFVSANNSIRPRVVDTNKVRDAQGKLVDISPDDPRFFSGCYVNAMVRIWFQDNEHGQRVNCSLENLQYYGPGEPFSAQQADADESFGGLGEEAMDPSAVDPALM